MAQVEALGRGEEGAIAERVQGKGGDKNARTALYLFAFITCSILAAIVFREDGRLIGASVIAAALALLIGPAVSGLLFSPSDKASENSDQGDEAATRVMDRAARGPEQEFDYGPTQVAQLRQTLVLSAVQLWALAALAIVSNLANLDIFKDGRSISIFFSVFGFAILAPLVSFGVEAVRAEKLPPRPGDEPKHKHITGFGALALVGVVVGIIVLAAWAATDKQVNSRIHAEWGAWIVYALVFLFLLIAVVPSFSVPLWLVRTGEFAARVLWPVGRALSVIDSLLVHCVAPAAGATLRRRWVGRYAYLAAYVFPLGVMGYWLPAPLGLVPIAWALIAAVSISRRWAWVEDDRETAMLTAQFRSENLRVGFNQDLRDEALLAFVSMFFLLPLALRQGHEWGEAFNVTVFMIRGVDENNLFYWIQYFGSELAKAVPFVDWAEIYDVEGSGPIQIHESLSKHVVFATRVLVDLVLLAALLQAFATFARNAKQVEMFNDGVVDRFDPFMERAEFQKIVVWENGRWERKSAEFEAFGRKRKYSLTRLLELKEDRIRAVEEQRRQRSAQRASGPVNEKGRTSRPDRRTPDWAVWAAAEFLYARDYRESELVADLYAKLREESGLEAKKGPNKDAVANVLDELEKPGRPLELADLNDVREHLNRYATAWLLRQRLIVLIARKAEDPDDEALQISALAAGLSGGARADPRAPNRRIAFEALKQGYSRGEREAVKAIQRAAKFDQAGALRKEVAAFVEQNPREVGPEEDDPAPTV